MNSILIVGLGSIGQRHLANLRALGVEKLSVVSRSSGAQLHEPHLLEGVAVYRELERALETGPEAVVVANPTAMHVSTALEAARRGCRLFIEKPLAHTFDQVSDLEELIRKRHLTVRMGFHLRFHPGLRTVQKLLRQNRIGRTVCARVQVGQYLPDWHPWEDYRVGVSARHATGGGVILDLIHELDYVNWLFGPVRRVSAMAGHVSSPEIETEDVAEILLECERVPVVEVHLDYIQRQPARTCHIFGEAGTIAWDYYANRVEVLTPEGKETYPQAGFERNQLYVDEMRHWLRHPQGAAEDVAGLPEGIRSLEIALAAKQAARTGTTQFLPRSPGVVH